MSMIRRRLRDERCPGCEAVCGAPCVDIVAFRLRGERQEIRDPAKWHDISGPGSRLELSFDSGRTWELDRACSDRNTVDALARGLLEYVSHRSRRHEYPSGVMFRWYGHVLDLPRRRAA